MDSSLLAPSTPHAPLRRFVPPLIALIAVLVFLAGCGGSVTPPPDPGGVRDVAGTVVIPAGAGIDVATLTAVTGMGAFPIAADGSFAAQVIGSSPTEVAILDASGALVMSATALAGAGELEVSTRSSAAVLLYYALGGFLMPEGAQDELWTLIDEHPTVDDVSAVLTAAFTVGGLPMVDEDNAVAAALDEAWQTIMQSGEAARPEIGTQTTGAGNVVIEPGAGVVQAGVAVIHNPLGAGVAAQNTFRRPAALLAYQVGYQDDGGADQEISPPVLTATIDVPSTGSLGVMQALTDIVKGESPWSPEVSEGMSLSLYDGQRTYYQLVLLGPSLDLVTRPPLYDDPRFSTERGHWNDVIGDKAVEQFFNDIALPALETFAFGGVGHIDASKLGQFRQQFKALNDTRLASLGIFLKAGGGYAEAVKFVIAEMSGTGGYRLDFMDVLWNALKESEKSKLDFDAVESRLRSRSAASGVAAAVQLALGAGDIAAILKDLNDALPAVGWTATASPTLFVLSPEFAYFTKSQPQVALSVAPRGAVDGTFLYRWSTSGNNGHLTDGPKNGVSIDTAYSNVWFIHNAPFTITDDQADGVWVEVFDVPPGTTTIPAGQEPVARLAAELKGFDREIDSRLEVQSGMTAAGYFKDGITVGCSTMYLRIPKQAGVKRYDVSFEGWGGVGNEYNYNSALFYNSSYVWQIDPTNPDGYIWPFTAVCDWFGPDGQSYAAPYSFKTYDAGSDYLVAVQTSMDFVGGAPPGAVLRPEYIRFWYDWASQGTVTVTVVK
ncbi:MAG TPA: hypothetical protein VFN03_06880 [Trueperaceae bacterium]|nr:hypothetical protein [Trueperaceae bacterium]